MRATFQVILKKPVFPQFYLAQKLYAVVKGESSAIGDYDFETINEWIRVRYYTAYNEVDHRNLIGFTLELPSEINERISRRIIEGDEDDKTIDSLGSLLQTDIETVEAFLRYEDDNLLEDIKKYHPEIFELEMKLREVLNYILCYNLHHHDVFDFVREFQDIEIKNPETNRKIKKYRAKRENGEDVKHPFSDNFENELFHLVVHDYIGFTKPKVKDYDSLIEEIQKQQNDIDYVRTWLKQAVDFSLFNAEHQTFINNIETRLKPVEDLRNDIMHNRKIPLKTINDFEQAKTLMLGWIEDFWKQELNPGANRVIEAIKQAEYILKTLLDSWNINDDDSIYYTDLNLEEQKADDIDDLKSTFLDIINDKLEVDDQNALAELISNEINKKRNFDAGGCL